MALCQFLRYQSGGTSTRLAKVAHVQPNREWALTDAKMRRMALKPRVQPVPEATAMKLLTKYVAFTLQARELGPTYTRLMAGLEAECAQTSGSDRACLDVVEMQDSSFTMVTVRRDRYEPCSSPWTYAYEPIGRDLGGEHVYWWALQPGHKEPEAVIQAARDLLFVPDLPAPADVRVRRIEFPYAHLSGWCVSTGDADPFFRTLERVDALQRAREAAAQRSVRCFMQTGRAYRRVT
jgi:hypothetical protein